MRRQIAALALMACWPFAAHAGLEICNQTSDPHAIAIGYKSGDNWVSEGWWNVAPGDCTTPVSGDLQARYYYMRATASGRSFQGEGFMFCTQTDVFTIVGDSNCEARGFETSDFQQIDTGETAKHHTHLIVEPKGKSSSGKAKQSAPQPTAAQTSGLVRGQHGEPFSSWLVFQACDIVDGLEACSFVGNGWRYYAFYDDPTPSSYLSRFETLDPGTLVSVTGDLVGYVDRTAELAITEITNQSNQDPYSGFRQAMQGNWVSADGGNETLYIYGAEMHSYFDGDYTDTFLLSIDADCPDSAGSGPVVVQTSLKYGDEYCYLIDNLAGGWMDLILMGHEAMISYRKAD